MSSRFWMTVAVLLMVFRNIPAAPGTASLEHATIPLNAYLSIQEDSSSSQTFAQIRSGTWTPNGPSVPNFAFSKSAWWIHFKIKNPHGTVVATNLIIDNPLPDSLQFYLPESTEIPTPIILGDRLPFHNRTMHVNKLAVPITFAPHQVRDIYIRSSTWDGLHESIPIRFSSTDLLWEETSFQNLIYGLYFGGAIILMIYSIVLYALSRSIAYVFFLAFSISFILWSFTFFGYTDWFLWPQQPAAAHYLIMASVLCHSTSLALFTRFFLPLNELSPRLGHTISGLGYGTILVFAPVVALQEYSFFFRYFMPIGLLSVLLEMYAGFVCAKKGNREGLYLVCSWSVLVLGAALYIGKIFMLIPAWKFIDHTIQIGYLVQVIVLAVGVAFKLDRYRQTALRTHQENARLLEAKVEERTAELHLITEKLRVLSDTDHLTGLQNRRAFEIFYHHEWQRHLREKIPLSIIMLDVDHFKAYNDSLGHPEGDRCLQKIAQALRNRMRRSGDVLARYGGEEFIILLPHTNREGANIVAQSLRESVENLQIPHPQSATSAWVTISLGFSTVVPSKDCAPQEPVQLADQALYQSKDLGRNQVYTFHS